MLSASCLPEFVSCPSLFRTCRSSASSFFTPTTACSIWVARVHGQIRDQGGNSHRRCKVSILEDSISIFLPLPPTTLPSRGLLEDWRQENVIYIQQVIVLYRRFALLRVRRTHGASIQLPTSNRNTNRTGRALVHTHLPCTGKLFLWGRWL
jgi:hypothetical protein